MSSISYYKAIAYSCTELLYKYKKVNLHTQIILKMLYMDTIVMESYKSNATKKNNSKKRINPFEDPITRQDAEIVVKSALGSDYQIINHHVRTFSEEKLGFLGAHRHLVVTVQKNGHVEKQILTFFLKSVPYDIAEQASVIEDCKAFFKETNFYRQILPELLRSVKNKSWIAQSYLIKDDVIVFEDLGSKNFALKDKLLADVSTVKSALCALATLHGSSMLAEKRLGKSFYKLYPDLLQECLFDRNGRFKTWFHTGVDVVVAVSKYLGLDPTSIPAICNRIYEIFSSPENVSKRRNVICHGDTKSYNMMFDDSIPLPKCVLLDFQLVRYAPVTTDVLQFLYLNTRREFRIKYEEELLEYYHKVLKEVLIDNDKNFEVPEFSEILQEYEDLRFVGIVTAVLYHPINFIEGKTCAEMTKDSDGFSKILFGDRVQIVLDLMKQDSLYNDLISESVTEMIERSKQLLVY